MKPYNVPLALFYFRHLRTYTQAQLATQSGVSQHYISRIEKNQKQPPLDTLEKLLTALDVSFSEFFTVAELIAASGADKAAVKLVAVPAATQQLADTIEQLQQRLNAISELQQALSSKHPARE